MIREFWRDLRYGLGHLRKHPVLSIIIVLTLTIGIGVSTGIFTYFNAEFLRARVDKDFESFVHIYSGYTEDQMSPAHPGATTLEDYLAFRDQAKSLRNLGAYAEFEAPISQGDSEGVRCLLVTPNFFSIYDLHKPLMGRLLQEEDCTAANPVVVISERLWSNRLASDPQIIGKSVRFNGQPVTVVGVTPKFAGMVNGARAWFPYTLETYLKRGNNLKKPGEAAWLNVVGRLNPGFSQLEANNELGVIATQQDQLHPKRNTTITVTDGSEIQDPGANPGLIWALILILAATAFFVMIVCVNVTTLLLARAALRQREIAMRLALGAGRMRLVRMLFTETLLSVSLAGFASLYLSYQFPRILLYWLTNQNSETVSNSWSFAPDWRVFLYIALITLLATAIIGLTPTLQSIKGNISEMLKGPHNGSTKTKGSRLLGLLVGTQAALSFFLLFGAAFLIRTSQKASSFDTGLEPRQVLWARLVMGSGANKPPDWGAFHRALTERLSAIPGVQAVAYSNRYPYVDLRTTLVRTPGQAMRKTAVNWVSPSYFSAMGISIVSGRALEEGDSTRGKSGAYAVVSQTLAREFWPNENPLGKKLQDLKGMSIEVVGIARDVSIQKIGGREDPMIYRMWDPNAEFYNPFIRYSGDGDGITRAVTSIIREIAPPEMSVRAITIQALKDRLIDDIWRLTQIIVFLCAIAVILATIGIYGIITFAVAQRTKELGIRIALGAGKKDIYRAVIFSCGRPVAIGILAGLIFTVAIFSTTEESLKNGPYAMNINDPIVYFLTAVVVTSIALAAMFTPARRAMRIDPMLALRSE